MLIFGSFGDAEFHNALSLDLDRFTSSGIAADPSFAIDQNELAQTRKGEGVFGVFVSQVRDVFQDFDGLLFGDAVLVSEFSCDLGFGQCFGHNLIGSFCVFVNVYRHFKAH